MGEQEVCTFVEVINLHDGAILKLDEESYIEIRICFIVTEF